MGARSRSPLPSPRRTVPAQPDVGGSDLPVPTAASVLHGAADGSTSWSDVVPGDIQIAAGTYAAILCRTIATAGPASRMEAPSLTVLLQTGHGFHARDGVRTLQAHRGITVTNGDCWYGDPGVGLEQPDARCDLVDDFVGGTNTSGEVGEWGWSWSGGSLYVQAGEEHHPGVREFSTNGGTALAYMFLPAQHVLSSIEEMVWIVKLGTVAANWRWRCGMSSDVTSEAPSHFIGFEKLTTDANIFAVVDGTRTDTGITATSGAWYKLTMMRDGTDLIFRVNDEDSVTIAAPALSTVLMHMLQIRATDTTSRDLRMDYFRHRSIALTR